VHPDVRTVLERLGLREPLAATYAPFSGWIRSSGAPERSVRDPSTGEELARIATSTPDDYARVLDEARRAFVAWREVPAPKRGELVRRIGDALRDRKEDLATLVSLEVGKITPEALGEVQEMIDMADFAVGQSRMLYGRTMPSERPGHRMFEQWHPRGVVAVVTAFNFPVAVWSWNALLAAVCGDSVVWKPSPKGLLCALGVQALVARTVAEVGLPPIFGLLGEEGHALAERLCDDPRVDLLSFTGSTAVGRRVAERVARRLGHVLLELGGNNAIVVEPDADLELVTRAVLFGAVGTAGQRCTTTRRLFVARRVLDPLVERLTRAYVQVRIGNPRASGVLMGPLIDAAAVERYRTTVDEIRRRGGTILYGGTVLDGPGYFVSPTLVLAESDWPLLCEETFAPILYVVPYDDLDEALRLHNAVPQGLSSAIFTQNLCAAERFLSAAGSDCGIANVNIGTSGAEIGGAFGGEKDTGGGREAGSDAWKNYMRRQTNTVNWSDALPLAQGIDFGGSS
jgi:aldehyde dehydrogenase (NAD+)